MITFEILGKVQGKARARTFYNQKLKRTMTYTPEQTVNYESWIKLSFLQKYKEFKPIEEPISVTINCFFKKSKSNKMKEPTIKPDTDNIAKVILDALNGLAYLDDKQITTLWVYKQWGDVDKVEVTINIK